MSTDQPDAIREERHLHGLQAQMLSDPELVVIDAFGLRNEGYHSAPPGNEAPALPVPTTLLVDKDGTVLWMDVSDTYQQRSGPEVVLQAMQTYLD